VAKKRTNSWVSWSKKELDLLKRLFALGKGKQIAEKIGRPLSAVRQKAYSMGLTTRPRRLWTPEEIEIVRKLYPTENTRSIAERLGRSKATVIVKAHSIGIRKADQYARRPWSKREDAMLRKLYPCQDNPIPDIAEKIGRAASSVAARAHALGIRRRNPAWSKKDLNLLKKLYPTQTARQLAEKLGRSVHATNTQIWLLGLKKRERKKKRKA